MDDVASRARAARAYAGLQQKELAALLEVDVQTVKRTEAGKREPAAPERDAIADHCGVPRWFMEHGFLPAEVSDRPAYDRLTELERQLMEVRTMLEQIAGEDATRRAVSATRGVSGALKDQAADDESERPAAADTRDEGDATSEVARAPREAKR